MRLLTWMLSRLSSRPITWSNGLEGPNDDIDPI